MSVTHIATLIDQQLWHRAVWRGVAFSYQDGRPPFLALVFGDRAGGRAVLRHLRTATGPVDTFELIRIAIIEGEIPGRPPGYTVYIAPNIKGFVAKAVSEGTPPPDELIGAGVIKRILGTRSLGRFKRAVAQHHRYFLVGATFSDRSTDFDVTIEKTLIVFKHVSQIGKDDIDKLIFARDMHGRPHWRESS